MSQTTLPVAQEAAFGKLLYVSYPFSLTRQGEEFLHKTIFPVIYENGLQIIDSGEVHQEGLLDDVLMMPLGIDRELAHGETVIAYGRNREVKLRRSNGLVALLGRNIVDGCVAADIGLYALELHKPVLAFMVPIDLEYGRDREPYLDMWVDYLIRKKGKMVKSLSDFEFELQFLFQLT